MKRSCVLLATICCIACGADPSPDAGRDGGVDAGAPVTGCGDCPAGELCIWGRCADPARDADGDGVRIALDCDDEDAAVGVTAEEECRTPCGVAMRACRSGAWGECPAASPRPERCDGTDEDCDGAIDEGLTHACTVACGGGVAECTGGAYTGCGRGTPVEETCDGTDEDCDGEIDEHAHQPCSSACGDGSRACDRGRLGYCTARTALADERCNAVDDDCDGLVDEALAQPCGECGAGNTVCAAGHFLYCNAPDCGHERVVCQIDGDTVLPEARVGRWVIGADPARPICFDAETGVDPERCGVGLRGCVTKLDITNPMAPPHAVRFRLLGDAGEPFPPMGADHVQWVGSEAFVAPPDATRHRFVGRPVVGEVEAHTHRIVCQASNARDGPVVGSADAFTIRDTGTGLAFCLGPDAAVCAARLTCIVVAAE